VFQFPSDLKPSNVIAPPYPPLLPDLRIDLVPPGTPAYRAGTVPVIFGLGAAFVRPGLTTEDGGLISPERLVKPGELIMARITGFEEPVRELTCEMNGQPIEVPSLKPAADTPGIVEVWLRVPATLAPSPGGDRLACRAGDRLAAMRFLASQ
jgi:hypothetical protein